MAKVKTARLKDIAAKSGLAIGTVSRVLRSKDTVSAETRKRVFEVARELKFRPNLLVRGMQTGRSRTIGVLMYFMDPYQTQIVMGVHDTLLTADHIPMLASVNPGQNDELAKIHHLVDRRVDGVILVPVERSASDEYFREIWDRHIPLVSVDQDIPHAHVDFVGSEDEDGARQAAEHLLKLGHRTFGQIYAMYSTTGTPRREAFAAAVRAYPGARMVAEEGAASSMKAEPDVRRLLERHPGITAVFANNDHIAECVYRVAEEKGLHIGRDISLVGFADLPFARYIQPGLTTVRQNAYQIGVEAAKLLLRRLKESPLPDGRRPEPVKIRLPVELIVRESTAPPRNISG